MRSRSLQLDVIAYPPRLASFLHTFTEIGYLGDWSSEKDCSWRLTFRQPVRKPYSESSDSGQQQSFSELQSPRLSFPIKVCYSLVQIILLFISSLELHLLIIRENTVYMNWLLIFLLLFFSVKAGKFKSCPSYHCWRYVIDLPAIVLCYTETIISLQHFVARATFSYSSS